MHNWRLLLLALLAACQPSASFTDRTLIDGRRQCSDSPLQQRDTRDSIYGVSKLEEGHRLSREVTRNVRRDPERYEVRDSRRASVERRIVDDRLVRESSRLTGSSFRVQDRVGADIRSRITREVDSQRLSNAFDRIREVSREYSSRYARDVRQDGRSSREPRQNELRHHRLFNDERIPNRGLREERNRVFAPSFRNSASWARPEVTRARSEVARRSVSRDAIRAELERTGSMHQRMNMRCESRPELRELRSSDRALDATERRNIDIIRHTRTNQRIVTEDDRRLVRDARHSRDNARREVMERSERSSIGRSSEIRPSQNKESRRMNNHDLNHERISSRVADDRRFRSLELSSIHRVPMESRNNDRELRAFNRGEITTESQRRDIRRMERDSETRDQHSTRLSRSDVEARRVDSRRTNEREIRDNLRSTDRRQMMSNERLELVRERRTDTDRLIRSADRTPVVRSSARRSDSRFNNEPDRVTRRRESHSSERFDAVRDSRARVSRSQAHRAVSRRDTDRRDVDTRERLSEMPQETRRDSRDTLERESRMIRGNDRSVIQSTARFATVRDQRMELNRKSRNTENTREIRRNNVRDDTRRELRRDATRMAQRITGQERLPSDRQVIRSDESRKVNTRITGIDRSINMRIGSERNMRRNARDTNRNRDQLERLDAFRDTSKDFRSVSRPDHKRMSNSESHRIDSRRVNERFSRVISRNQLKEDERRDTLRDKRVEHEVPEIRFEARSLKNLERDTVDLAGRRNSWNPVNEKGQMDPTHSVAMNWQYLFYTLQGLYLGGVILQMIGASDKNKMKSTGFWASTQKMLKVE